jgi:hypothetical protein
MKRLYRGVLTIFCLVFLAIYINIELDHLSIVTADSPKQPTEKNEAIVQKFIPVSLIEEAEPPKPENEKFEPLPEPSPNNSEFDEKRGNQDPAVLAQYNLPIQTYLSFMIDQGSQLGLYNTSEGKFVCTVDLHGRMKISHIRQNGMSARARRVTDNFPNKHKLLQEAVARFGPGSYEILLLIPKQMDDRFYGNIYQMIRNSGSDPKDISLVRVTYASSPGAIKVEVNSLEGRGGIKKATGSFYL